MPRPQSLPGDSNPALEELDEKLFVYPPGALRTLYLSTGRTQVFQAGPDSPHSSADGTKEELPEELLFVHGFSASISLSLPFLNVLRKRFRVTCINLPGHGGADPTPDRRYPLSAFLQAVSEAIVLLGLDKRPLVLVGHSMGGQIACELAQSALSPLSLSYRPRGARARRRMEAMLKEGKAEAERLRAAGTPGVAEPASLSPVAQGSAGGAPLVVSSPLRSIRLDLRALVLIAPSGCAMLPSLGTALMRIPPLGYILTHLGSFTRSQLLKMNEGRVWGLLQSPLSEFHRKVFTEELDGNYKVYMDRMGWQATHFPWSGSKRAYRGLHALEARGVGVSVALTDIDTFVASSRLERFLQREEKPSVPASRAARKEPGDTTARPDGGSGGPLLVDEDTCPDVQETQSVIAEPEAPTQTTAGIRIEWFPLVPHQIMTCCPQRCFSIVSEAADRFPAHDRAKDMGGSGP